MLFNIERDILLFIQNYLRFEILTPVMKFISATVNNGEFFLILSILLIFFRRTRKAGIISLISIVAAFYINNILIKNWIMRPRPFNQIAELVPLIRPQDYSFASGHTVCAFSCAFPCWKNMKRAWSVPIVIYAILVAYSRLYLGVHFPTDVLGGIVIAKAVSEIVGFIFRKKI